MNSQNAVPNTWVDIETGTWGSLDHLYVLHVAEEDVEAFGELSPSELEEVIDGEARRPFGFFTHDDCQRNIVGLKHSHVIELCCMTVGYVCDGECGNVVFKIAGDGFNSVSKELDDWMEHSQ